MNKFSPEKISRESSPFQMRVRGNELPQQGKIITFKDIPQPPKAIPSIGATVSRAEGWHHDSKK